MSRTNTQLFIDKLISMTPDIVYTNELTYEELASYNNLGNKTLEQVGPSLAYHFEDLYNYLQDTYQNITELAELPTKNLFYNASSMYDIWDYLIIALANTSVDGTDFISNLINIFRVEIVVPPNATYEVEVHFKNNIHTHDFNKSSLLVYSKPEYFMRDLVNALGEEVVEDIVLEIYDNLVLHLDNKLIEGFNMRKEIR